MNLPLMQDLIDRSLATASQQILSTMADGMTEEERAQRMADAAKEVLDALQTVEVQPEEQDSRMPNYEDQWVALAYTQWYQLRQIHLAYSLSRDLLDADHVRSASWHEVFEIGCGALAFAIGLTLAISERLEDGKQIGRFVLRGYDHRSLRTIGETHWSTLRQLVGAEYRPLPFLKEAMDRISFTLSELPAGNSAARGVASVPGAYRWLVGQHIAYELNQDEVRNNLARLFQSIAPSVGLVSGPTAKGHVVDHISPFRGLPECELVDVTSCLFGTASAITAHRMEIAGNHARGPIHLLRGQVSWNQFSGGAAPYVLRYLRHS